MVYTYPGLYDSYRWRKLRRRQLRLKPLCERCEAKNIINAAEVVHHVHKHHGDKTLFYTGRLESLCKACHDGITQHDERYGYSTDIGKDGWPLDPNHPVYRERTTTNTNTTTP